MPEDKKIAKMLTEENILNYFFGPEVHFYSYYFSIMGDISTHLDHFLQLAGHAGI
jgi:hypothetical protein